MHIIEAQRAASRVYLDLRGWTDQRMQAHRFADIQTAMLVMAALQSEFRALEFDQVIVVEA